MVERAAAADCCDLGSLKRHAVGVRAMQTQPVDAGRDAHGQTGQPSNSVTVQASAANEAAQHKPASFSPD